MSYKPKYSDPAQAMINACQAAAMIDGCAVVINPKTKENLERTLPPDEFGMFQMILLDSGAFIVWLKIKP